MAAGLGREACEAGELDAGEVDGGILRATQIWRPLLAVADVLGDDWPERARAACEELSRPGSEADEWLTSLQAIEGLFDDEEVQA